MARALNELKIDDATMRIIGARARLRLFGQYVTPAWDWTPKHIALMAAKLEAVERGEIKRLMIFLPPRSSKSENSTIHFPAWYMMRNPDKRVIVTSYSADLAKTFSRRTREMVREHGKTLFDIELSDESASVEQWSIKGHHGMYIAAGVGGAITGQGAACFPAGTMIETEAGPIDIEFLISAKNPPLVLSYDHETDEIVFRRILANRRKVAYDLTEIETSGGRKVRSTPDHRIYEAERGYKQANLFNPGDRLISAEVAKQQDVCALRRTEERSGIGMQSVLPENTQGRSHIEMRMVQPGVRQETLRVREGVQTRLHRLLLFAEMHPSTSCNKEPEKVSGVWRTSTQEDAEILLTRMPEKSTREGQNGYLSDMSYGVSPDQLSNAILFESMLQQSARSEDEGQRKFSFQRRKELCKMVQRDASRDIGKGRFSMCGLWDIGEKTKTEMAWPSCPSNEPGYSPHQRGCEEQYGKKSCDTLLQVSSEPPQSQLDTVSVVSRIRTEGVYVYDIQIEGTSNFFANGILVHNCLIIDDPTKNADEANSPTYRQRVWDWWTSTAYTRLDPDGAAVLTMTRWHEDDLAGRLLKEMDAGGEQWEVLRLPAIAEDENDPLNRRIGAALWPTRYTLEDYDRIRTAVGTYVWNALYQQRPQSIEGGAFKASWFKWYTKNQIAFDEKLGKWRFLDEPMPLYQGVDPAISEKESADDFADVTIGVSTTNKILILDPWHGHIPWTEQPATVVRKYQEWLPERVGIETNAFQMALKQQVVKDALVPVKGLHHSGDKYTRIMSMTPYAENGQVYLRMALDDEHGFFDNVRLPGIKIHDSMKKIYEQMVTYGPRAAHDDLLDAMENAISLAKPKIVPNEFYT